jgi:hypothetical protein
MSELINRWFGRAARLPGVIAYGLRYGDSGAYTSSWEPRLSDTVLNELWNRLARFADTAAMSEVPQDARWTFHGGIVIGAARPDGAMFFVLVPRSADGIDEPGISRLLSEFRSLRA